MKLATPLAVLGLVALLASSSCADEDASFAVKYAPGFTANGNAVSVFGVFRDGRMSPETWDEIGPRFAAALRTEKCDVAVDDALRLSNVPLFTAVDDAARGEGITDPLLDKFAPSALGDSILVVTIAGHPKQASDGGAAASAPVQAPQARGGGRGRRSAMPRSSGGGGGARDNDVYEISASLFSNQRHQSVALVSMIYRGASETEALSKFTEKLSASLPGSTCRGWNAAVRPTEEELRHLPEP